MTNIPKSNLIPKHKRSHQLQHYYEHKKEILEKRKRLKNLTMLEKELLIEQKYNKAGESGKQ